MLRASAILPHHVEERGAPLVHIQIAGDDGTRVFVTLGDEIVEIFVLGCAQRPQTEIIDDDEWNLGELLELALIGVGGARGMHLGQQLGLGGEEHVIALAQRTVDQCLGQVTFAGADRPNNILPINIPPKSPSDTDFTRATVSDSGSFAGTVSGVKQRTSCSSVMAR